MSNLKGRYYNIKIEGLELLYHLLKNKNMEYKDAISLMIEHKQDMTFLDKLKLNKGRA